MNKYLVLISSILVFSMTIFAQEQEKIVITNETNEENSLKSFVTISGASYSFIFDWREHPSESHWTGFGYAFSTLRDIEYENVGLNLSKSYSTSLNLTDCIFPLGRNWLIGSGLGFNWLRYNFGSVGLEKVNGITQFVPSSGANETYYNSKLRVCYATTPFFLEYQAKNGDYSFFINGGLEGLIKCGSNSFAEVMDSEGKHKRKFGRDLNILPVNFRFFMQVGFANLGFFGYYQPYSIFEKGKGPDVKPMGIGLKLNL